MRITGNDLDKNSDEFLATQLENVYRSSKGKQTLYSMSNLGGYATKNEIYRMISLNNQLIQVMRNFLMTEPLVKQAATLKAPDFNPFRDFPQIEAEAHKRFIDL